MAAATKRVDVVGESERLDVTDSRYPPGERGPGPHVHHHHTDGFWVLDGELEFGIGPELATVRLRPGGFVLVPPDVVHTFRNPGPAPARFLNFHAPSMGFAAYLRGELRDFDQHDPPADGGRPAAEVLVGGPGDGPLVTGHIALGPASLEPGATLTAAQDAGDALYVLEGSVTALRPAGPLCVAEGEFAWFPPGTAEALAGDDDAGARFVHARAPGR